VDALRALAICGVVLGHWLVTAFVVNDGQLRVASPLTSQPYFVPISWLLQTLAVFFLVGGYAAARSFRTAGSYGSWLGTRMYRLVRPVLALLAFWTVAGYVLASLDLSSQSMHSLRSIVISPLWFLGVYAALTVLTPLAMKTWRWLVPVLVLVVAGVDLVRFGFSSLEGPWPPSCWCTGSVIRRAWSAYREMAGRTSTRRRWPRSPSASRRSGWRC
jgi:hypothetical protein